MLFKYADDSTIIVPAWNKGECSVDLVDQFLDWSHANNMSLKPSKCKELIFRKRGFTQFFPPVHNIPQCTELTIPGVTFEENCKYT